MLNGLINMLKSPGIPDFYTIDVSFVVGDKRTYDVVRHNYLPNNLLELVLCDDTYTVVVLQNVLEIKFSKSFTNLLEAKQKSEQKQNEVAQSKNISVHGSESSSRLG